MKAEWKEEAILAPLTPQLVCDTFSITPLLKSMSSASVQALIADPEAESQ